MAIHFTKMQALGNDFMVVDGVSQLVSLSRDTVAAWADRKRGVGFDQLLLLQASADPAVDFIYRIFNADGSEVAQCGNGARAVAVFIQHHQLRSGVSWVLQTQRRQMKVACLLDGQVEVDMGVPELEPAQIPFLALEPQSVYPINVEGVTIDVSVVGMGNPHAVFFTQELQADAVQRLGKAIMQHRRFPEGVNVGFAQVVSPTHLKLRVYERGAGETLACGSGACAAMVAGKLRGLLSTEVRVEQPGGLLNIGWCGRGESLLMRGGAEVVFDGQIS